MQVSQYPRNADGTPMDLLTGVLVDATGNGGARLTNQPTGPDKAPIDTVGLVLIDINGNPFSLGNMVSYATRDLMNNVVPAAGQAVYLSEAGREGFFKFSASNLSVLVAADTYQGLFVAPESDVTGASGAWVRQFDYAARCTWFGILPGIGDISANVISALAVLKLLANPESAYGYGRGSIGLYFPELGYGYYNMGASTIDITHTIEIYGDNRGGPAGTASILKWSTDVTGFRTQAHDTTGATGGDGTIYGFGSAQTTIRNLGLVGAHTNGAESEAHAIHLRNKAILRDLYISNWAGEGVYGKAYVLSLTHRGNINGSIIDNVFVYGCRNGGYFAGADSNVIDINNFHAKFNRRYGLWVDENIGLSIKGGDLSTNGNVLGFVTKCSHMGKWYYCLPDQEAWASVNPPTGTVLPNQGWAYHEVDAGPSGEAPAWTNGMAIRAGGSLRIDGGSSFSYVENVYREADQAPFLFEGHVTLDGGLGGLARCFDGTPYGGQNVGNTSTMEFARGITVGGEFAVNQRTDAIAAFRGDLNLTRDNSVIYNPILHINTTGTQGNIIWRRLGVEWGRDQYEDGNGSIYHFLSYALGRRRFYIGGNPTADIGPSGLSQENLNAYNATTWNGSKRAATEGDVRNKIEALQAGSGTYFKGWTGLAAPGDTTAFATKGATVAVRRNITIEAVEVAINSSSGLNHYVQIATVVIATGEIVAVIATSNVVAPGSAAQIMVRFPFAAPVDLSAGTDYIVLLVNSSGSGTTICRLGGATYGSVNAPADVGNVQYRYNTIGVTAAQLPSSNAAGTYTISFEGSIV